MIAVNNKDVNCISDTGADINVMSLKTFTKLNIKSVLNKSNVQLSGFSGKSIPVVGQCDIICKINGELKPIPFVITNIECPTV